MKDMEHMKDAGAPELLVMVGLPGSGKSRYCAGLNERLASMGMKQYVVVSSDTIRGELYGDETEQGDKNEVFGLAMKRTVAALKAGDSVAFDSTSISKRKRRHLIDTVRRSCGKVYVSAVWMATALELCVEQDAARERSVGKPVINMMYKSFAPPGNEEGFDRIMVCCRGGDGVPRYTTEGFFDLADGYDQRNSHHTLTLGEHSRRTAEKIRNSVGYGNSGLLHFAALIHDNGKLDTASPYNLKGELTQEMHYYQHNCCGAYNAPFFLRNSFDLVGDDEIVYVSNLVYYHMHPYVQWTDSKARERDFKRLGGEFFSDVMLLHEADAAAH